MYKYFKLLLLFTLVFAAADIRAQTSVPLSKSIDGGTKKAALVKKPALPASVALKNAQAKKKADEKTAAKVAKQNTKQAATAKNIPVPNAGSLVKKTPEVPVVNAFEGPHGDMISPKPKYPGTYSATPITSGRKPVIVIDPGHGGKDPGTRGTLGTNEKDLTLRYGLALKNELEKLGKYKVVMTRTSDRFVMLSERVKIARKAGGDVMISIHADSSPNKTTRGFSVYTLSSSRADYEAKKLLELANKEEVIRGASLKGETSDVKEAMIDFAQSSSRDVSHDFAETLGKYLGKKIKPLEKNQREASLAVLTGADIPSVLIELGYLSNADEERLLKLDSHRDMITTSIAGAVTEYFNKFKMVF